MEPEFEIRNPANDRVVRARRQPTVDDYFRAAGWLAAQVRQAFRAPGSVPRERLEEALEDFERVEKASKFWQRD